MPEKCLSNGHGHRQIERTGLKVFNKLLFLLNIEITNSKVTFIRNVGIIDVLQSYFVDNPNVCTLGF